ncbi:hypothetical protein PGTUg99_007021 [Puccinia graminis f. sp. tritici]|uniref:Uncharacterized protein n=1 Tax=Puccinia graminis f. sp. tritici TaxID=56615 RepID=A0A5B0QE29_PUCGR|nr:hypothetical protein PGTUg99_007021 [Puccinia graminis f. sp. tritici]
MNERSLLTIAEAVSPRVPIRTPKIRRYPTGYRVESGHGMTLDIPGIRSVLGSPKPLGEVWAGGSDLSGTRRWSRICRVRISERRYPNPEARIGTLVSPQAPQSEGLI